MIRTMVAVSSLALLLIGMPNVCAAAGTLTGAKVALHLAPHSAKVDPCLPESQGGQAPDLTPCSQYETSGLIGTGYDLYLTLVAPGPPVDHPGVAGLSCGILYQGGELGGATRDDGTGVDVYQWNLCASGLQFTNGPTGDLEDEWPASGGGNRITFDASLDCQLSAVPGHEAEGVVAVFGAFYVFAYSPDLFQVTPNNNLGPILELVAADCNNSTTDLSLSSTGAVAFSADGSAAGVNPCGGSSGCEVSPTSLDFGPVVVGQTASRTFSITNTGDESLTGEVNWICSEFYLYGSRFFVLSPGQSQTFTAIFAPRFTSPRSCTFSITGGCTDLTLTGEGVSTPPEIAPVVALHVSPPADDGCSGGPRSPCSDYVTQWPVGQPATVWLVVAKGPPEGVGGLTCGLFYEGGSVGGETREDGIGIDVDSWNLCASGLQYTSGCCSPEDEWPASGGGIRLTWDTSTDCQTTVWGDDGVHAVAGYFTVNAYSPDQFAIGHNNSVSSSPVLSVTDCDGEVIDLLFPQSPAAVGFGDAQGYNPCNPDQVCSLSRTSIDIGEVEIGQSVWTSFDVTNRGAEALPVTVSENSESFLVSYGSTSFSLPGGASRTVSVLFTPRTVGVQTCTLSVSGGCSDVVITAEGTAPPRTGQEPGVIALHATSHVQKGECANAPTIPCSDYVTEWPVGQSADVWLVAVSPSLDGIGALSCGIRYDNGAEGGETMTNGIGVDLYEWTLCTSGIEFPNALTGYPADEWPASGGGNRITWNASADCQTTEFGGDGIHAIAGFFYVYAYSPDLFEITVNQGVEPTHAELQVGNCDNMVFDLPFPEAAGAIGFGGRSGYNPCAGIVPVRLLSFTAARVGAGAEIRWAVADAEESRLGFEVYRGRSVEDRVMVSSQMLTGRESYVFVDEDPPSTVVNYWLAERSRAGTTAWHGPAALAAASVAGPGLVLRHASPNPFLSATRIMFRTGADGPVEVRVYDTAGREVARPYTGSMPAGEHEVAWDGRDDAGRRLSAGVYLYRIESAQGGAAGKVVLVR